MNKYIFILGQSSDLAKQELISILGKENILDFGSNFLIANQTVDIDSLGLIAAPNISLKESGATVDG